MGTGIALRYKDNYGDSQTLKMEVIEGSSKKQGMTWVAAMQKVGNRDGVHSVQAFVIEVRCCQIFVHLDILS